jgi:hypothetical protein
MEVPQMVRMALSEMIHGNMNVITHTGCSVSKEADSKWREEGGARWVGEGEGAVAVVYRFNQECRLVNDS